MSRFELLRADTAEMTVPSRLIVEANGLFHPK
jgi:hypothetical protein